MVGGLVVQVSSPMSLDLGPRYSWIRDTTMHDFRSSGLLSYTMVLLADMTRGELP